MMMLSTKIIFQYPTLVLKEFHGHPSESYTVHRRTYIQTHTWLLIDSHANSRLYDHIHVYVSPVFSSHERTYAPIHTCGQTQCFIFYFHQLSPFLYVCVSVSFFSSVCLHRVQRDTATSRSNSCSQKPFRNPFISEGKTSKSIWPCVNRREIGIVCCSFICSSKTYW